MDDLCTLFIPHPTASWIMRCFIPIIALQLAFKTSQFVSLWKIGRRRWARRSAWWRQECLRGSGSTPGTTSSCWTTSSTSSPAVAIAAAFPCLKCTVLDLPHVVAKAPSISIGNVQFVAGDMFESIPLADAVFLKVHRHVVIYMFFFLFQPF